MRVVLCCLAKKEHKYINDFVKWYIDMGFDTIYVYDNDEVDEEHQEYYVDTEYRKKVIFKNVRGFKETNLQHRLYTGFYAKYGKEFDWVLYCDVDEYLFGVKDIKAFLSQPQFYNVAQIRVKWKLFGDDDLITRDMSKPVYECFHNEIKYSLNRALTKEIRLQDQGKMFVRGKLNNILVPSCHYACYMNKNCILRSVLPSGKPCYSGVNIREDYSNEKVFLHHYMTKSLSEFVEQKLNRNDAVFNSPLTLNYYWRINKKTEEKLNYLREHGYIE